MNEDSERIPDAERKAFYENIDFKTHWYPVFPSDQVRTDKPVGIKLLGIPLVLYRDPETGKPVVLDDKCAHRR